MEESYKNNETIDEALQNEEDERIDEDRDREHDLKSLFEAVFFLSNEPVPINFFVKSFMVDPTQAKIIIDTLVDDYEERDGGIRLAEL